MCTHYQSFFKLYNLFLSKSHVGILSYLDAYNYYTEHPLIFFLYLIENKFT